MKTDSLAELRNWLPKPPVLIAWLVLIGLLGWAYHEVIGLLILAWWEQPEYGHGFFVPAFSVVLLWVRRKMVDPMPSGWTWWAMAFFGLWLLLRLAAARWAYLKVDAYSMLPCLVGLALFMGGWQSLRWSWPAIMFLIFMIPLPVRVSTMLSSPLQTFGTHVSVRVIQTLGIPAVAVGNVIKLREEELEVAQACSGLRMLMLFFAVCVGAAFLIRRPLWEKTVVVISAIPIAIFANVARISATAFLTEFVSTDLAHLVHDMAGWFMMPVALLVLWAEMALLNSLFLEPESRGPLALGGPLGGMVAAGTQAASRQDKQT